MPIKLFRPVIEVIAISILVYLLNWIILLVFLPLQESQFNFPLWSVYAFFTICAILITLISIVVRQFNIHSVGQVFMLTTFCEMFSCFAVFYGKLNSKTGNSSIERANFIIVFLLFLTIETIITIRLLNKKQ